MNTVFYKFTLQNGYVWAVKFQNFATEPLGKT